MIDDVRVESDESGFRLILVGDLTEEAEEYLVGRCRRCGDLKSAHVIRRVVLAPGSAGELRRVCRSRPGVYEEAESSLGLRLSQDAALKLLAAAEAEIGPWRGEMEAARGEYERSRDVPDPAEGYDLDDPKSPGYYERMADAADLERGRRFESAL